MERLHPQNRRRKRQTRFPHEAGSPDEQQVDGNHSFLALVIVRKSEQEIPGLTDTTIPRRLGPKRASRIRKLFNLSKEDDVRQYVVKRPLEPKEGKTKVRTKAPKIQPLITPVVLQRKRHRLALKKKRCLKRKEQEDAYAKLLAQRKKESKARRELIKRRRSASMRGSKSSSQSGPKNCIFNILCKDNVRNKRRY
ncbi:hypothetical protein JTB14_034291 [Gonioctena quinquepunctata]|nr:hypothetical protein JTB14_034291 [Gonioctena quinquepunctata]